MLTRKSFNSAMVLYRKVMDTVSDHMVEEEEDAQISVLATGIVMFICTMKLHKTNPERFGGAWQLAIQSLASNIAADELVTIDKVASESAGKEALNRLMEITKKVNSEK